MLSLVDFAIFPLIASCVVSLFIIVQLIIALKRNPKKVSVAFIIAMVLIITGAVLSVVIQDEDLQLFILTLTVFAGTALLIPQAFKLTKKEEIIPAEVIEPEEKEEVFTIPDNYLKDGVAIADTGKEFVFHAAEAFSEESGLSRLLDFINASLIREIKADGGAILLVDDFEDVIAVKSFSGDFPPPYKLPEDVPHKIVRVETSFRFAQFGLGENIFGEIARSGKPELITDPLSDSRIYQNEPEDFLKCGSYIIIPLTIHDTVIGVAALARRFDTAVFTEDDFTAAKILTDFACASIKNVYSFQEIVEHSDLTKEAEMAGKIQLTLHPKLLPSIPGLSLGSYFNTSEGVCGDYYDVLPSRKDRISFILADVAGKGMNSLVIMVMIRAILRLIVNTKQSAATIISWANRGIAIENNIDHFASLALINYDSTTNTIQYATAGSTPILYFNKATGDCEKITSASDPIGVEKTTEYTDKELKVNPGDIIAMYSDGLVEAVNSRGKQYSVDSLMKIIIENNELSSKEIASLVKADVKNFTGSAHQHDDQTLLVIKIQ